MAVIVKKEQKAKNKKNKNKNKNKKVNTARIIHNLFTYGKSNSGSDNEKYLLACKN